MNGAYPEYRKAKLNNGGLTLVNDVLKFNVGDGLILRNNGQLAVRIGSGLKFENGVLSLDIENGDNLKYGTSTQSTEINENEVTTNE